MSKSQPPLKPWQGEPDGLWPVEPLPAREETRTAAERLVAAGTAPLFDYPRATRLGEELAEVMTWDCNGLWPGLMIVGPSSNGRTVWARSFVEKVNAGPRWQTRAWLMQMTPGRASYETLWLDLHRKVDPGGANAHLSRAMREVLTGVALGRVAANGLRIVLIDRCDAMLELPVSRRRLMLFSVQAAMQAARVPFVLVGTPKLASWVLSVQEQVGHYEMFHLPRWRVDRDYLELLNAWDAALPLLQRSGLAERELALHLFALSDGRLGVLAVVLRKAAMAAIKGGSERITIDLLDDLGLTIPPTFSGFW